MNVDARIETEGAPAEGRAGSVSLSSRDHPMAGGALFPLAALFMVAVAAVLAFMGIAANNIDKIARDSSTHLIASVFGDMKDHFARLVFDYSRWNETAEQAQRGFDPKWVFDNIGEYLIKQFALTHTAVIDGNGRVVVARGFLVDNDMTAAELIAANIIVPEDAEIASRYPAPYPVLFLAM